MKTIKTTNVRGCLPLQTLEATLRKTSCTHQQLFRTAKTLLCTLLSLLSAVLTTRAACPPTPDSYCVDLPAGKYVAMVNHLGTAPLSSLIPNAAAGMVVTTYSGGFTTYVFDDVDLAWMPSEPVIQQGQGFLVWNPIGSPSTETGRNGTYVPPNLPRNLVPGTWNLIGRPTVGLGTIENILGYSLGGCPGLELKRLNISGSGSGSIADLNSSAWITYTYNGTTWSPSVPVLNVGEAAFIKIVSPCSSGLTFSASGVYPGSVGNCGVNTIKIVGSALQAGSTVRLKKLGQLDIVATSVTPQAGGYELDATLDLSSAVTGVWDVEVTDPGSAVQTITGGLTITGVPTLNGGSPHSVSACNPVNIDGYGSAICSGAILKLKKSGQADRVGSAVSVNANGTQISAAFDLTGAASGNWDLEVVNPSSASATLAGLVNVMLPSITSVSPNLGGDCAPISITANLVGVCSVSSMKLVKSGQADRVGSSLVLNANGSATATFNLSGMPAGSIWDVVVVTPANGTLTLPGAFQINSPWINPNEQFLKDNCSVQTLTIHGHNICPGGSMRLVRTGQSDIVGSGLVGDATQTSLTATFNLVGAAAGGWDVVVTDGNGAVTILLGSLTIAQGNVNVMVPNQGGNCGYVTVNVGGEGLWFASFKLVRSGQSAIIGTVTRAAVSGLGNEVKFNLNGAALGVWDLEVTFPNCGSITLPGAFTVQPVAISMIQPVFGKECQTAAMDISGSCFAAGATVKLKKSGSSPITGTSTVINGNLVKSIFNLAGAATGIWDVEVTSPNGDTTTLAGNFTVLPCTGCDMDVTLNMPSRVGAARQAHGSISYLNNGSTTVNNVAISVSDIPADAVITLVSGSPVATITSPSGLPQTISFIIPTLGAGQSGSYYFDLSFPTVRPPVQLTGKVTSPCINTHKTQCEVVGSTDPNDKLGLVGNGANHYMAGSETMPYEIHFENKASATAPAQEVFITDKLDPAKLDLSTFSLGTITFRTHSVTAPAGLSVWTTYVPYAVNGNSADDIVVKITCALVTNPLDPNYGQLNCSLRSLDPATGLLPSDPLRGFLPPNVTPPQGQGSVTYAVKAQASLATDDAIGNNASIVFDLNPPILTPVWVNIIDKTAPQSSVTVLPPLQGTLDFTVSWSGTDTGSGIAGYDVFVSDNNGPYTVWLSGTTTSSATFNGQGGHTYRFYSVAMDQVSLVESAPGSPDATTMVRPWLTISRSGNDMIVAWEGTGGTLQEAGDLSGIWTDINGATSPYVTAMCPTNHFFRLRP